MIACVALLVSCLIAMAPASPARAAAPLGGFTVAAAGLSDPYGIAAGADGNLWFTNNNDSIGRITPAGVVSDFGGAGISQPFGMATGPDGNVWFTNSGNDSIGRITPAGVVSTYTSTGISRPEGIAAGPDGNLWFTNNANSSANGSIGRITTAGVVSNFVLPAFAGPQGIVAGPDGNLWFANTTGNSIGRITPAGVISTFTDGGMHTPADITAGADGNLWFTNTGFVGTIGRITPAGVVSTFTGPNYPRGISAGPDGNVWFTNSFSSSIGRITPVGSVTTFTGTGINNPGGITAGPDGSLWFTNQNAIGRITTAGVVSTFTGTGINRPHGIAPGPDGNLWFTNGVSNSIGRVTPAGVLSTFTGPGVSTPGWIAAGPDGNMWFTNPGNNSIGRISPAGVVSNFTADGISDPEGITGGPDGNLWFTNYGGFSVGRITPAGVISIFTGTGVSDPAGITVGPDGNLWFTNYSSASIGRITPAGTVSNFTGTGISHPYGITAGSDGNLWFTNADLNGSIGRITPAGVVSNFADPGISTSNSITEGADGALWFTNWYGSDSVGRITTAGTISYFTDARLHGPQGITAGSDGNLWFTDRDGGSIDYVGTGLSGAPPGAAGSVTAVAANGSATVSWTAPIVGGGSPIDSYTATAIPGGQSCTWSTGALACAVPGLTNDASYRFQVFAHNAGGNGAPSAYSNAVTPTVPTLFHALAPVRILDSRPGVGNVGVYSTPWGTGTTRDISVGGLAGVPTNADAVVLNVTVTGTTGSSFLTVWPAGQARPTASSLNWTPGRTIPNAVTVKLGAAGKISVFNLSGNADVIADVAGYYDQVPGDGFTSLSPARILDSRPGVGNIGGYTTPWGTGTRRDIAVGGLAGVPGDADGVVLNVTVTGTSGSSFLTVWPAGQAQPTASSLNWTPGVTIPNAVTVKLGAAGKISMYNLSGNVDVIADVAGYFQPGTGKAFHALNPGRALDSRPGVGNIGGYGTPWRTGTNRDVTVGGLVGVPTSADAVVLNVTVTDTTGSSFLSIWPAGQPQPTASSLNWTPGVTIPNAVTVKVGSGGTNTGKISMFNLSGSVDVITDAAGWFG